MDYSDPKPPRYGTPYHKVDPSNEALALKEALIWLSKDKIYRAMSVTAVSEGPNGIVRISVGLNAEKLVRHGIGSSFAEAFHEALTLLQSAVA